MWAPSLLLQPPQRFPQPFNSSLGRLLLQGCQQCLTIGIHCRPPPFLAPLQPQSKASCSATASAAKELLLAPAGADHASTTSCYLIQWSLSPPRLPPTLLPPPIRPCSSSGPSVLVRLSSPWLLPAATLVGSLGCHGPHHPVRDALPPWWLHVPVCHLLEDVFFQWSVLFQFITELSPAVLNRPLRDSSFHYSCASTSAVHW